MGSDRGPGRMTAARTGDGGRVLLRTRGPAWGCREAGRGGSGRRPGGGMRRTCPASRLGVRGCRTPGRGAGWLALEESGRKGLLARGWGTRPNPALPCCMTWARPPPPGGSGGCLLLPPHSRSSRCHGHPLLPCPTPCRCLTWSSDRRRRQTRRAGVPRTGGGHVSSLDCWLVYVAAQETGGGAPQRRREPCI